MPKQIRTKIGEVHKVETIKTLGDRLKEFLEGLAGLALVVLILAAIFG